MGLPKKLTEQQIKFANLLISEQGRKTATQCAIDAGYAKYNLLYIIVVVKVKHGKRKNIIRNVTRRI